MNNKNLLNLIRTIGIGIICLFALNMIVGIFDSDEKIESEVKDEILKSQEIEIKDLKDKMDKMSNSIEALTKAVNKQKVEYTYYYKNVVEDSTRTEEFKKASKYTYWFVHYADLNREGYNVLKIKGNNFNFDKVVKIFTEDGSGEAKQFGGITDFRRITQKEFLSAREDRRRVIE
jgi:hypothetical protein